MVDGDRYTAPRLSAPALWIFASGEPAVGGIPQGNSAVKRFFLRVLRGPTFGFLRALCVSVVTMWLAPSSARALLCYNGRRTTDCGRSASSALCSMPYQIRNPQSELRNLTAVA
jgi:hypothetical protein